MYVDRSRQWKRSFEDKLVELGFYFSDSFYEGRTELSFEPTASELKLDNLAQLALLLRTANIELAFPLGVEFKYSSYGLTTELPRLNIEVKDIPEGLLDDFAETTEEANVRGDELENNNGCILVDRMVQDADKLGFDLVPKEEEDLEESEEVLL